MGLSWLRMWHNDVLGWGLLRQFPVVCFPVLENYWNAGNRSFRAYYVKHAWVATVESVMIQDNFLCRLFIMTRCLRTNRYYGENIYLQPSPESRFLNRLQFQFLGFGLVCFVALSWNMLLRMAATGKPQESFYNIHISERTEKAFMQYGLSI